MAHRGRSSKPIFVQIAKQVVNVNPTELRLPSRAWKVKLVGEGADDAGGVFDDTVTEMCQVHETSQEVLTQVFTSLYYAQSLYSISVSLTLGAAVWSGGFTHSHSQQYCGCGQ